MLRKKKCGCLKRLIHCNLQIMAMILTVPWFCWTNMRFVIWNINSPNCKLNILLKQILRICGCAYFGTLICQFLRLLNVRWPNETLTQELWWRVARILSTLGTTHQTRFSHAWSAFKTSGETCMMLPDTARRRSRKTCFCSSSLPTTMTSCRGWIWWRGWLLMMTLVMMRPALKHCWKSTRCVPESFFVYFNFYQLEYVIFTWLLKVIHFCLVLHCYTLWLV